MHRVSSTWANCAPGLKWKFVASLVALVVGLALVVFGVSMNVYLDHYLDDGIRDFLVVDSKSSSGYGEWEFNGIPVDKTPQYMKYYLWNLTNADQLRNATTTAFSSTKSRQKSSSSAATRYAAASSTSSSSSAADPDRVDDNADADVDMSDADVDNADVAPIYERVGPFVYRRYVKRVNVTFVAEGEQVYYAQYIYYAYDEARSGGLRPDDPALGRVTNLNSAYMAVLAQTGGEQNLVRALTGPTLAKLFTSLGQPFGLIVAEVTTSTALPLVRQQVLQYIETSQNVTQEVAEQLFATTWANATAPEDFWQTMGVLSQDGVPSNLSAAVVAGLWDSTSPLPNLVNTTYSSAFLWFSATYLQDPTAVQTLAQAFGLELPQLQMVLAWRAKFLATTGVASVFQRFNVTSLDDLIYLQWGEGSVTNGTSLQQLLAGSALAPPLAGIPEFAIWAASQFGAGAITFDAAFSRTLLNGTSGLFNSTNLGTFLYLVANCNEPALQQLFQLSLAQAGQVAQYLGYIGSTFVDSALQQAFAAGGGLITSRTPQEWLWGVEDPLLKLLGLPATVSLATNMTSEDDALNGKFTSLHYTGKGNIDNIARYIDYCGVRVYPAGTLWAEDEKVDGTEGMQFRPSLDRDDELRVWSYELMRQIPIHYEKGVSFKDIDLYRYTVSERFFLPQPKYYQTITGFANMTHVYNHVPIFISKPNMLDCEAEWRDKLVGMEPSNSDDTILDIEPYTGYTMNVAKQLQINIYLEGAGSPLDLYNKDFLKGVIYPIFYANQQATIGDSDADDFKNQVYLLLTIRLVVFWVGISVGSLLAAVGLVVLIFVILKNRSFIRGYEVIGDQYSSREGENDIFSSSRSRVRS